jgi:hypothetical protein
MEESSGLRTLAAYLSEAKRAPRASEMIPERLDLARNGGFGWNPAPGQAMVPEDIASGASGGITPSLAPSVVQSVRVPLEPQASQRNFRTRLPRNGLAALAGLAGAAELGRLRSLDGFVSLVCEQLTQGFIRHSGLAFPHAPGRTETRFAVGCAIEMSRSSAGAALHEPRRISAPRLIPPLRLMIPGLSDRIAAATRVCLQRVCLRRDTGGIRPVRGKYWGVPARLVRETVNRHPVDWTLMDPAAPAILPIAETVSLLEEPRDGKAESEVAPIPALGLPASSILASLRLTGLCKGKMPPPRSIGIQPFLTFALNVPIPSTVPQPPPAMKSPLNSLAPVREQAKGPARDLVRPSPRTAGPLPQRVTDLGSMGASSRTGAVRMRKHTPPMGSLLAEQPRWGRPSVSEAVSGMTRGAISGDLAEPCPARSNRYSSLGMLPARSAEAGGFRQRPRRGSVEGAGHL